MARGPSIASGPAWALRSTVIQGHLTVSSLDGSLPFPISAQMARPSSGLSGLLTP